MTLKVLLPLFMLITFTTSQVLTFLFYFLEHGLVNVKTPHNYYFYCCRVTLIVMILCWNFGYTTFISLDVYGGVLAFSVVPVCALICIEIELNILIFY